MLTPRRTIVWAHQPVPSNPFPARRFRSLSLGKESRGTSLYVPLHLPKNVKEVTMNMSHLRDSGRSNDLTLPFPVGTSKTSLSNIQGKGKNIQQPSIAEAFQHPVKVLHIKLSFMFSYPSVQVSGLICAT